MYFSGDFRRHISFAFLVHFSLGYVLSESPIRVAFCPSGLNLFTFVFCGSIMAPRSWSRTVDIECKDFLSGTLFEDVVKLVLDYLVGNYPEFKVNSIQPCSGRVARITFSKDCPSAKSTLEELGEVTISGVQCFVLRSEPLPPRVVNVLVYQYPYEFPKDLVATVLDKFGAVKDVSFQHWTSMPDVSTGMCVVCMVVEKDIPRFLFIRGIRCRIWYHDQPSTCDICSKEGHKASACPDKGKCLRCHQPGHVAHHCPTPWGNVTAGAAAAGGAAAASGSADDNGMDVSPVIVDKSSVLPVGDLSHGLQHAQDLDKGFDQSASASSDDHVLAAAASVAEAVVGGFSQSASEDGADSVVEGVSSPPSQSPILLDDLFNQLDELYSQQSSSFLANCRPGGAGGEFVNSSQIHNNSSSSLSSANDIESNLGNDNNNDNVNYYGSEVTPPFPPIVDSDMSVAPDPHKRPISDASSDDASSDCPVVPNSKISTKKSKMGVAVAGHLPGGVASAACLAVSRGLTKK